jgi:hypothetical protein
MAHDPGPEGHRTILIATLVGFLAITGVALAADGVAGFPRAITPSWAAGQIYVDLVIAVVVICVWLHRDARQRGRNPWPWIVAAAVVGMISPLRYLIVRTRPSAGRPTS